MATYYVSNAATNGYVVGNDSNDGLTKATAWLTVMKAHTAATNGDTVTLNDGTYLSTDGASGAAQFDFTKSISWSAETAGLAILTATATGAGSYVVSINRNATTTITFSGIKIDAQNTQEMGIKRVNTTNDPVMALTNCVINNWLAYGYWDGNTTASPLTITNCSMMATITKTSNGAVSLNNGNNLSVVINGLALDLTSNVGATIFGVDLRSVVGRTSVSASITGLTGTIRTLASNASSSAYMIFAQSMSNLVITGCTFTVVRNTGSGGAYGIQLRAANSLDGNGYSISSNTLTLNGDNIFGIQVATDTTGADNNLLESGIIEGNTLTGNSSGSNTPHGIAVCFQSTGIVRRNIIKTFNPALQFVGMSGGTAYANKIHCGGFSTNGALWVDGCSGGTFANNTVYFKTTGTQNIIRVKVLTSDGVTNTSAFTFSNNLIYADIAITRFVLVDASQTATFDHNLYFSTVALPTGCFSYQGTTYDTVAAWTAARETTAVSGAPLPYDPGNGDFRLNIGSAAVAAGAPVFGVKDYTGKRYNPSRPDIGAYVSQRAQARSSASARTARS